MIVLNVSFSREVPTVGIEPTTFGLKGNRADLCAAYTYFYWLLKAAFKEIL